MSTIPTSNSVIITRTDFERLRALTSVRGVPAVHSGPFGMLRHELARGVVVSPAEVPGDVVTMRSRVRVRDPDAQTVEVYTLVYPEEADFDTGRVSVLAPLGTALLGTRAGDTIHFDTPGGRRTLIVEAVSYQPEAAGEFHL